ncbi:MAG: S1C family serine protease [Acidimicrobiales bacterium]
MDPVAGPVDPAGPPAAPQSVPAVLPLAATGQEGAAPVPPPPAPPPPAGQPPGYPVYPGGYGPPGYPPAYHYSFQMAAPPRAVRHTLGRRTWVWLVLLTALVAALVGGLVGAVVGAGNQQTIVATFAPNRSVLIHPQDVQEVLAKVEPAVVSIDSESGDGGSSAGGDFVQAAGSGMILTPEGEVLTNNHVIAGAASVTVTLFGQTKALSAHVLGTDPTDDLALVQIDHASSLPTVTFGNSSQTRVGDSVLAIGNALALAGGPTVTEGIVSAENRSLSAESDTGQTENLNGLLQTDAAINPGNSGGPLVNSDAQVVGMNTAVASSSTGNAPTENIGFAITVDSVKPRLAQLRQGGSGGTGNTVPAVPSSNAAYIGVTVGTVTPALQQQDDLTPSSGALVLSVQPGSPADNAALQVNDVVISLNSTAIQSPDDLTAAIHPLKPGDRVSLGIYRGSNRMTVPVTLGTRPTGG